MIKKENYDTYMPNGAPLTIDNRFYNEVIYTDRNALNISGREDALTIRQEAFSYITLPSLNNRVCD